VLQAERGSSDLGESGMKNMSELRAEAVELRELK
jgi:hypothetical protein